MIWTSEGMFILIYVGWLLLSRTISLCTKYHSCDSVAPIFKILRQWRKGASVEPWVSHNNVLKSSDETDQMTSPALSVSAAPYRMMKVSVSLGTSRFKKNLRLPKSFWNCLSFSASTRACSSLSGTSPCEHWICHLCNHGNQKQCHKEKSHQQVFKIFLLEL